MLLVASFGVLGYMLTEDLTVLDAIYFTVITISTVGFSEPGSGFSPSGQVLTMVLVLGGIGSVLYTATIGIELGIESLLGGERQVRKARRQVDRMENHIILCGWGRVGRGAWERFATAPDPAPCIVVEVDPERAVEAREHGAIVVEGDATHDETLIEAGIERARTLVASVRSDADNLVIVLSAKSLRPDLLVVARATEAESERKLRLAGADRVVAPQLVGAYRLAALAVAPEIAEFLDLMVHGQLVEFRVEQFEVAEGAPAAGKSLRESDIRGQTGALVLAVQDRSGAFSINPDADFIIEPGQVLYGIGTRNQVAQLRPLLSEMT